MTGLVVSGPRPVKGKGGMTQYLVIVKTTTWIKESRFWNEDEAEAFAKSAREGFA